MENSYDDIIKKHYDKVAETDKSSSSSTMADDLIREKETKFIFKIIKKIIVSSKLNGSSDQSQKLDLLDVGCGNGYTLLSLSKKFKEFNFHGIEFNDSLLKIAQNRFDGNLVKVNKGDLRDTSSLSEKKFDVIICQRVLINLLNSNDQKSALNNIINMTKKNGVIIFIEAFNQGLDNLNLARKEFGLKSLPPAMHNLYLDDDFFETENLETFYNKEASSLSTHYFVSRVLHEIFIKETNTSFTRNSHFVKFFSNSLKHSGDYSPLKFYSFKRI